MQAVDAIGAEVEVDTEAGHVRVLRMVNAADLGLPLNPKIVETRLSGATLMQLTYPEIIRAVKTAAAHLCTASAV